MSQHDLPITRAERIDGHQLEQAMPLAIARALAARRVGQALSDEELQAVSGGLSALASPTLTTRPLLCPKPPIINGGIYVPTVFLA